MRWLVVGLALAVVIFTANVKAGDYVRDSVAWCNSHCGSCDSSTDCPRYAADCAHFAMQCVIAGGCGPPDLEISSAVYSWTHYKNKWNLAWTDSARGTTYGGT